MREQKWQFSLLCLWQCPSAESCAECCLCFLSPDSIDTGYPGPPVQERPFLFSSSLTLILRSMTHDKINIKRGTTTLVCHNCDSLCQREAAYWLCIGDHPDRCAGTLSSHEGRGCVVSDWDGRKQLKECAI